LTVNTPLIFEKIEIPNTLTVLHTYQCTAACKNCCFGSNPSIKGRIPQERIKKYIHDAAEMGIKLLVFSGGEAFLMKEDLDENISFASSLGLVTRIVTNAYWATSEEVALNRLGKLKQKGLREINFSTGDFHQEFVPIERIINGILAALRLNMPCALMIEVSGNNKFTKEMLFRDARLSNALNDRKNKQLFHILESPWISMNTDTPVNYDGCGNYFANRDNINGRKRCSSILSTLVVDPDENLSACCGLTRHLIPELQLGSLKNNSMKVLFDSALEDFLKIWIFTDGPEKILAWASEKDRSIDWENKYAHICDACRALYKDPKVRNVIRNHYSEKVTDVYFRYWLLTKHNSTELTLSQ